MIGEYNVTIYFSTTLTSDEEKMAQDLVEQGQIDQAIDLYQQLRPESARIYRVIGMLYAEKKGRFDLAISCYEQALHIHELVGRSNLILNQQTKKCDHSL